MAEVATALLALWNDVDPALEADYNAWHAQEHVPERLGVPGMLFGLRFRWVYGRADGGADSGAEQDGLPRYLTLYGLRDASVLDSAPYQRLLDQPTPASRRMRPTLRHIGRWVCRIDAMAGLDGCDRLAVWTAPLHAADPQRQPVKLPAAGAHLLAQRLPQARDLPWLRGDQHRAIDGDWLCCVGAGVRCTPAVPDVATAYARLPVGPSA